jgi:prepilin-type N-terminal cleavage/methylation domain-containing protein
MFARIRKMQEEKEGGFTLIELLVVMIIIGILAAIAIPLFLSQRKNAVDASIKSDLRTLANEAESVYTDSQAYPASLTVANQVGQYQDATPANVGDPIRLSKGNTFTYVVNTAGTAYCINGAQTGKATHPWTYISNQGGLQDSTVQACPAAAAF